MIALICEDMQQERLRALLSAFDEVKSYPGASEFAYNMLAGSRCRLLVVAKDGATGMNECDQVRQRKTLDAVLWITEQAGFLNQSKRMGVERFLVRPVSDDTLRETVAGLLANDK